MVPVFRCAQARSKAGRPVPALRQPEGVRTHTGREIFVGAEEESANAREVERRVPPGNVSAAYFLAKAPIMPHRTERAERKVILCVHLNCSNDREGELRMAY